MTLYIVGDSRTNGTPGMPDVVKSVKPPKPRPPPKPLVKPKATVAVSTRIKVAK